jgi:hypothetical protein
MSQFFSNLQKLKCIKIKLKIFWQKFFQIIYSFVNPEKLDIFCVFNNHNIQLNESK